MVWLLAVNALRLRPVRTTLTALGIAVAVAATIIFLSLGEGVRQIWTQEIGSVGPDLQVSYGPFDASSVTTVPELPLSYRDTLEARADEFGITRVTPLLFHVRGGLNMSQSFVFQGLPAGTPIEQVYVGFEVVKGRLLTSDDRGMPVALVGQAAAERNGLDIGDSLRLNPGNSFEIVGIADSASGLIGAAVMVPLTTLQRALGMTDRVSFMALDLTEPGQADATSERLAVAFPDLGFQTRAEVLGVIEEGIRVADVLRLGISSIALIVGALAVANTMIMSVSERIREFGLVRAVGAKPRFLFRLVLLEAVLLSVVGAALGLGIGRLGIVIVNQVGQSLLGFDVAVLSLRLAGFAVALAIVIGLFSGLAPAARAARIPVAVAVARE